MVAFEEGTHCTNMPSPPIIHPGYATGTGLIFISLHDEKGGPHLKHTIRSVDLSTAFVAFGNIVKLNYRLQCHVVQRSASCVEAVHCNVQTTSVTF